MLIRDGVVVWEDDRITFVGKTYDGPVDRTLPASERLIMPGLIDLHWHAGVRANWRLTSDHGDPSFWRRFPQYRGWAARCLLSDVNGRSRNGCHTQCRRTPLRGCTTLVEVGASVLLVEQLAAQVERLACAPI